LVFGSDGSDGADSPKSDPTIGKETQYGEDTYILQSIQKSKFSTREREVILKQAASLIA
jgi:hypothetical protein